MANHLPRHARALLTVFANASSPLIDDDAIRILREQVTLRSDSVGLRLVSHLKKAGLIAYADATKASAEAALANAKRILDSLDDENVPEVPSVTRYELSELGRAYLRR